MSWLSKTFRKIIPKEIKPAIATAAPVLGGIYGGPLGTAAGAAFASSLTGGRGSAPTITLPGAGMVPMQSSLVVPPSVIKRGAEVAVGAGAGVLGSMLFDDRKKKYRRMNYGNMKAARRAIRRIKGTRKMLKEIERQLPKQQCRRSPPRRSYPSRAKGVEIVNVD